jgi:uncharacterized protein
MAYPAHYEGRHAFCQSLNGSVADPRKAVSEFPRTIPGSERRNTVPFQLSPASSRRAMMLTPISQHAEIAIFLSRPKSYHDGSATVRLRQTPTSWIFLTDHFAYKLKKPMRCGSEDFSTLELREKAFREELSLGRRFAPRVYLSVVSVKRANHGGLSLRGTGSVVDWLLEMRRLNERHSLAWYLETGEVRREMIERLAAQLTDFFTDQPPISLKADDFIATLRGRIEAHYRQLLVHNVDLTGLETTHRAQLEFVSQRAGDFSQRVCDGRIVEAHGDLRPDHIYLDEEPTFIGCITGNEVMRWSDVADDLALLAMECDRQGAAEVGNRIKECYIIQSGDVIDNDLFTFYKCYRAQGRAATLVPRYPTQVGVADYCPLSPVRNDPVGVPFRYALRSFLMGERDGVRGPRGGAAARGGVGISSTFSRRNTSSSHGTPTSGAPPHPNPLPQKGGVDCELKWNALCADFSGERGQKTASSEMCRITRAFEKQQPWLGFDQRTDCGGPDREPSDNKLKKNQ